MRNSPDIARLRSRLVSSSSGRAYPPPEEDGAGTPSFGESGHAPNVFRIRPGIPSEPDIEEDVDDPVEPEEEDPPLPLMLAPEISPVEEVATAPMPERGAERTPKVIVVDRSGVLATSLGKATAGLRPEPEILRLDRPTEIVELAEAEDPDVIVLGPEEVTSAGLKRMAQVHKSRPRTVILLSDSDRTWSAAQMAASGASDFLPSNPTRAKLRSKLQSALERARELRVEQVVVTERVVLEAAPVPVAKAPVPAAAGRVFVVASASGGSGKTLVATNLAAYLAKATGARVLLVDLDLQFGEVAPSLHLHPPGGIDALAEGADHLQTVVVDHKSGFKALCAPDDPLAGERIGPSEVSEIFDVARREFDFIVIDTPPTLNETCLTVFDLAETLLITANMDVPSLKNMRRYLMTIERLSVAVKQTVLVVNREEPGIGIDMAGVSQLFPQGFLAVLPASREITWATNMGEPIMHGNPKSDVSRRLAEGFRKLVPPVDGVTLPWAPIESSPRRTPLLSRKKGKD